LRGEEPTKTLLPSYGALMKLEENKQPLFYSDGGISCGGIPEDDGILITKCRAFLQLRPE
jgi:hypothetical protein